MSSPATDLVICAKNQLLDPLIGGIELGVVAQQLDGYLTTIGEATQIRGVLVTNVVKVKDDNGAPGKVRIDFLAPNEAELEQIETDWLTDPIARHIGNVAYALAGTPRTAIIWKNNTPDPAGKVSQGFRRVVWLEATPEKKRLIKGTPE